MKRKLILSICAALPMLVFAGCGGASSTSESQSGNAAESQMEVQASSEAAGGAVIVGTNSNLFRVEKNLLISDNLPIVVDFNATWCPPCKRFAPIFDAVAEKFKGQALFVSIDTDEYPEIANAYGISSIPTTVYIMGGGQELGKEVGLLTEEQFTDFVNQLVETSAGESGSL